MIEHNITAEDFGLPDNDQELRVFRDKFVMPTYEIVSNPTVRISDIRARRFNIIDRMQQSARQEIQAQEDRVLSTILDSAIFPRLNYQNLADRILPIQSMPQGAIAFYTGPGFATEYDAVWPVDNTSPSNSSSRRR